MDPDKPQPTAKSKWLTLGASVFFLFNVLILALMPGKPDQMWMGICLLMATMGWGMAPMIPADGVNSLKFKGARAILGFPIFIGWFWVAALVVKGL